MKKIITDADGCLVDWELAFHTWMHETHGMENDQLHNYFIHERYPGVTVERARELVHEFNDSKWITFMPAWGDSVSGVKQLTDAGYRFDCISSICDRPGVRAERHLNLIHHFGDVFNSVTCLHSALSKHDELSKYKDSGLFWIEDVWDNALIGAELGLRPIIITHAYNKGMQDSRIQRVNDWKDICEIILND